MRGLSTLPPLQEKQAMRILLLTMALAGCHRPLMSREDYQRAYRRCEDHYALEHVELLECRSKGTK